MIGDLKWLKSKYSRQSAAIDTNGPQSTGGRSLQYEWISKTSKRASYESSAMAQRYEVASVRRAEPPPGGKESNWHRYVISFEGIQTIQGCRQGNLEAVTRAVEENVAQLNERRSGHWKIRRSTRQALKKKPYK